MTRPIAAAAVVALLAALWLYGLHGGGSGTGASPAADGLEHEPLPGFRADAWYLPDDELLGFVEVPAGPFLMGSASNDTLAYLNERWTDGEGPHSVEVPAYFIGRFEVTVAQYRAFVEASGHGADPQSLAAPLDHPVTLVSWTDALAYALWLDTALRESPSTPPALKEVLSAGGHVTLPSDAEWEKAARGSDGRVYPWGNELRRDRANVQGMGLMRVGSLPCPECPFGLADMSGNAWEWTRSPFQEGTYGTPAPVDLEADALWTIRGGSFADPPRILRAALRGGADPSVRRPFIGFRVVISTE